MAREEGDQRLQLSILDRLIDDAPEDAQDRPLSRGQALRSLRESVRRDLENLLNSRQRCRSWPAEFGELDTSLLNYGIPDFTGSDFALNQRHEGFRHIIETMLKRYEPRFRRVRVVLLNDDEGVDRTMRLRIEALMQVEPAPEPIVFDSQIDPATGNFRLTDRPDG